MIRIVEQTIIQVEGNKLQTDSKLTTFASKIQGFGDRMGAIENAMRLLERMGKASEDGGKGIIESLNEMEKRLGDKFTLKSDFEHYKDETAPKLARLDNHEMRISALENDRVKLLEDQQKSLTKFAKDTLTRLDDIEDKLNNKKGTSAAPTDVGTLSLDTINTDVS